MRRLWLAVVVLACPAPLQAQEASSTLFSTRGVAWQPTVAIQDFGWDSNVTGAPENPVGDFTATLRPGVEGALNLTHLKLSGAGLFDLIYYEKTVGYRAFNRRYNGRIEAPLKAFVPYVAGAFQQAKDKQTIEIDTPQEHRERDVSAGANLLFSTRGAIQLTARRADSLYDDTAVIRGTSAPLALNHHQDSAALGARIALTELTTLSVDAQVSRTVYPLSLTKNSEYRATNLALLFAPDAVIRGGAGIGWKNQTTADSSAAFSGVIANVDVGYVLLDVTRFDGRYHRDTTVSVEAPYLVETTYGLDVLQTFFGPTELIGRITRTQAGYPKTETGPVRRDQTDTLGGGVAIRMGKGTRMTINYEVTRRNSIREQLVYERQRLFTSVSLGL